MSFGTYLVSLDFMVCKSIAALVILGCDFCDRYVEAISSCTRMVELEDGSSIPIFRNPLRSTMRKHSPLPKTQKAATNYPVSTKMDIVKSVQIPLETQVRVEVTTKQNVVNVAQSLLSLY